MVYSILTSGPLNGNMNKKCSSVCKILLKPGFNIRKAVDVLKIPIPYTKNLANTSPVLLTYR